MDLKEFKMVDRRRYYQHKKAKFKEEVLLIAP